MLIEKISNIFTGCSTITKGTIDIDSIPGLRKELDEIKEENRKLKEWIMMGAYSSK